MSELLKELAEDPLDLSEALYDRRNQLRALVGEDIYQRKIGKWMTELADLNRKRPGESLTMTAIDVASNLLKRGYGDQVNWVFA